MITYRLTARESGLALFALGLAAAGQNDQKRTDSFALAEKVSDTRVGGQDGNTEGTLTCSPGEQQAIIVALDVARDQLAASPMALKSLRELTTHLKTSGEAQQTTGIGARSGP